MGRHSNREGKDRMTSAQPADYREIHFTSDDCQLFSPFTFETHAPIINLLAKWGRQASTGAVTSVAMHAVLALCSSL